jgi:hypothetical protein
MLNVPSEHLPEEDSETTEKLEMKTWRMTEIFVSRIKCKQYTSPNWKKTLCNFMPRSTDASPQEPDAKQTYPFRGSVEDFSWAFLDFGNRCYFHHSLSGGNYTALLGHTNSCEDVISCKNSDTLLSAVLSHHDNKSPTLLQLLTVTTFVYCRCGSTVQE